MDILSALNTVVFYVALVIVLVVGGWGAFRPENKDKELQ